MGEKRLLHPTSPLRGINKGKVSQVTQQNGQQNQLTREYGNINGSRMQPLDPTRQYQPKHMPASQTKMHQNNMTSSYGDANDSDSGSAIYISNGFSQESSISENLGAVKAD